MAEIIHSGQEQVSGLSGRVRLETGGNRMVIYDGTKELLVLDENGLLFADDTTNRILLGNSPTGETGMWISNEGVDVLTLFS